MSEASVLAAFSAIPGVASARSFPINSVENPLGEPGKVYICFYPLAPGQDPRPDPSTGFFDTKRAKLYLPDRVVDDETNLPSLIERMTSLLAQYNK